MLPYRRYFVTNCQQLVSRGDSDELCLLKLRDTEAKKSLLTGGTLELDRGVLLVTACLKEERIER